MNEQATIAKSGASFLKTPSMLFSLLTVLLWGAWGLESKFVVDRMSPWLNQVVFLVGLLPPFLWMLFAKNLRVVSGNARTGAFYGVLTGLLGAVGNIAFYVALARGGKASVIAPLVGLAPLVTVVLAMIFLKESLNRAQMFGLFLALVSIVLLSL